MSARLSLRRTGAGAQRAPAANFAGALPTPALCMDVPSGGSAAAVKSGRVWQPRSANWDQEDRSARSERDLVFGALTTGGTFFRPRCSNRDRKACVGGEMD